MKRRRLWKLLAVAAIIPVAVVAALVGYDRWQDRRVWAAACAEADRLDPRWRWQDLQADRETIPDAENAALVVLNATGLLPPGWPDRANAMPINRVRVEDEPDRDDEDDWPAVDDLIPQNKNAASDFEAGLNDIDPNQRLRPSQADYLRELLRGTEPALDEARKLIDLRQGRWPRTWSSPLLSAQVKDFDALQTVRKLAELHVNRAKLDTESGHADDALARALPMFALARSLGGESLLDHLISCATRSQATTYIAQRALGTGEPGDASLRRVQARCEREADVSTLLNALRWERAVIEDLVDCANTGQLDAQVLALLRGSPRDVTGYATVDEWLHWLRSGGFRRRDFAPQLHLKNRWIELLKTSPDAPHQRREELDALAARLPQDNQLASLDPYRKLYDADRRSTALLRSTSAALACERFRRDRGRWPDALAELIPNYGASVPVDPFDFRPLKYVARPNGRIVYSVGPDGQDDGGAIYPEPRNEDATGDYPDIGFRLWDVPSRRLPPRLPKLPPDEPATP